MIHVILLKRNIPWFVEFFTELLLQIGLVPIQETDADILKNVSDKDKLQKLHQRFTSKVGVVGKANQRNKSSQRLSLDPASNDQNNDNNNIGSGGKMTSPDYHFSGNQEFFFRFMNFVDSYAFSIHLRNRLVALVTKMWLSNDTKGIEQRIMKMQMLSKFLGVLAFSPNWIDDNIALGTSLTNGMEDVTTPFFEIKRFVEKGWHERRLIVTIPWVVSFIQMISWDESSVRRPYYREAFSLLRKIHKWCVETMLDGLNHHSPNILLLSLQLESLFSDVVGLGEIECISSFELNLPSDNSASALDDLYFGFSEPFILSLSTHLDDLQKLVMNLSSVGSNQAITHGTSKKLKPYVLSSYPSTMTLSLIGEKQLQETVTTNNSGSLHQTGEEDKIIGKMIESFFHQHKDLQSICDFIIDLSLKSASKDLNKLGVDFKVKESYFHHFSNSAMPLPDPVDIDWYLKMLRNVEVDTYEPAIQDFNQVINAYITNAIDTIFPPDINSQVKDIAKSICISHACRKGDSIVTSFIRVEVKKVIDEHINKSLKNPKSHQSRLAADLRLYYCCDLIQLSSTVQNLNAGLNKILSSDLSFIDGLSISELKVVKDTLKPMHNFITSHRSSNRMIPLRKDLQSIFKDLLVNLINAMKKVLPQNSYGQFCDASKAQIQTFLEAIEVVSDIIALNIFPAEKQIFSNYLCDQSVYNTLLLWNGSGKNSMRVILEATAHSAIKKSQLEETIIKQIATADMCQKSTFSSFQLLGALRQMD